MTLNRLLACIHPFFLDQRDAEEAQLFSWVLKNGPFSAGQFLGRSGGARFPDLRFCQELPASTHHSDGADDGRRSCAESLVNRESPPGAKRFAGWRTP